MPIDEQTPIEVGSDGSQVVNHFSARAKAVEMARASSGDDALAAIEIPDTDNDRANNVASLADKRMGKELEKRKQAIQRKMLFVSAMTQFMARLKEFGDHLDLEDAANRLAFGLGSMASQIVEGSLEDHAIADNEKNKQAFRDAVLVIKVFNMEPTPHVSVLLTRYGIAIDENQVAAMKESLRPKTRDEIEYDQANALAKNINDYLTNNGFKSLRHSLLMQIAKALVTLKRKKHEVRARSTMGKEDTNPTSREIHEAKEWLVTDIECRIKDDPELRDPLFAVLEVLLRDEFAEVRDWVLERLNEPNERQARRNARMSFNNVLVDLSGGYITEEIALQRMLKTFLPDFGDGAPFEAFRFVFCEELAAAIQRWNSDIRKRFEKVTTTAPQSVDDEFIFVGGRRAIHRPPEPSPAPEKAMNPFFVELVKKYFGAQGIEL